MLKLLLFAALLLFMVGDVASQGQLLSLPEAELCLNRPRGWTFKKHNYYFSWDFEKDSGKPLEKVNWLVARNECRKRCMDTIGIETEAENKMIADFWDFRKKELEKIARNNPQDLPNYQNFNLTYAWTSGRLCDFKGCEVREDLQPINVFGWFWSNTNTKTAPTNSTPPGWARQPWSRTGHNKKPQPDNAEFDINKTPESCLGILDNLYNDGLTWHDIACYHPKPYICEDSDLLLDYIEGTHSHLKGQLRKKLDEPAKYPFPGSDDRVRPGGRPKDKDDKFDDKKKFGPSSGFRTDDRRNQNTGSFKEDDRRSQSTSSFRNNDHRGHNDDRFGDDDRGSSGGFRGSTSQTSHFGRGNPGNRGSSNRGGSNSGFRTSQQNSFSDQGQQSRSITFRNNN